VEGRGAATIHDVSVVYEPGSEVPSISPKLEQLNEQLEECITAIS